MRKWGRKIENLFFPKSLYCICCGKYIDGSRSYSLCDHCVSRMNFNWYEVKPQHFDRCLCAMGYGFYERRLIFNLKYDGKTYVAPIAAEIMADCLRAVLREKGQCPWLTSDLIIPVPISRERMKTRQFNQAERIGFHLGKILSVKVRGDVLLRVRDTKAQRALSAAERRGNMEGAFAVQRGKEATIRGKSILLIDDIFTTGATASACARTLKESGAARVYAMCLLGAPKRDHEVEFERQEIKNLMQ